VLFHLVQRRGFKSNRKQEKSKEQGEVAKETAELKRKMEQEGCRTLGEYLARLEGKLRPDDPESVRVRNRYTLRGMYEEEFEKLWSAQARFRPDLLTGELKEKLHRAIFFQRPLRYNPNVIGDCELEPGEKRCPHAHWMGQQFRMVQEINLLRFIDANGEERALNERERGILIESLGPKGNMPFVQIRELLGLTEKCTFNLEERSKRKHLNGNSIEAALRKKPLGKWYEDLPPQKRRAVYDALAEIEDEEQLLNLAVKDWGLDPEQAKHLLKVPCPVGYFRVSLKAIDKLMPFLLAGSIYSDAKENAGYSLTPHIEPQEHLPPVQETIKQLTNPLVRRALSEMRKVVNAIVAKYGRPVRIVVELARDMKSPPKKRREDFFENLRRRDENEEVRQRIRTEFPITSPSRDDVIKYKLWDECNRECPYTGRAIPQAKLFTGEIQIEHILPYSRTLDDSFMNKSLCYVDENRLKHNRTPNEAYSSDPPRYEQILQRVARLPWPKRRRFIQKQIDLDECVARQLNDTRFASRAAVAYLKVLYGNTQEIRVQCVKGGTTAELRHQWGLDEVLGLAGQKNRADHRHHAVDAVVVALTTARSLQQLSTVKYNPVRPRLDPPWESLRDDVAKGVGAINVSHRPNRKLAGALHQDTGLGPTVEPNRYVHRVPVESLTPAMVQDIRDLSIRKIVEDRCREKGIPLTGSKVIGKALGEPPLLMPSGVPIRRVRVLTTEKTVIPIRSKGDRIIKGVLSGSNHHVEVYQKQGKDGEPRWTGRAVSRFEAHQRLREGKPVVDRNPADGGEFVMSLCINDMFVLTDPKTRESKLYRVQKTSVSVQTQGPDLRFRLHTAARIDDNATAVRVSSWKTLQSLRPAKVVVDALGRIHPCHD
jgi:CRISPR-associated endonuclease Csn1